MLITSLTFLACSFTYWLASSRVDATIFKPPRARLDASPNLRAMHQIAFRDNPKKLAVLVDHGIPLMPARSIVPAARRTDISGPAETIDVVMISAACMLISLRKTAPSCMTAICALMLFAASLINSSRWLNFFPCDSSTILGQSRRRSFFLKLHRVRQLRQH